VSSPYSLVYTKEKGRWSEFLSTFSRNNPAWYTVMKYLLLLAAIVLSLAFAQEVQEDHGTSEPDPEIQTYDCRKTIDCSANPAWKCDKQLGKCVDCNRTVGGPLVADECNICGGNNECWDCNQVPYGTAVEDDCGVCDGNNRNKDDCGVCNGNNRDLDQCGVCFGDGTSCLGCDGVANSELVFDHCGICGGDDTGCCGDEEGTICHGRGACDGDIKGCVCDFGWTGAKCQVPQSYCHDASGQIALVDCGPHGHCSESMRGQCICEPGYFGPMCAYHTCNGNGVYSPSKKMCVCEVGFAGEHCDRCAVPGESKGLQEYAERLSHMDANVVVIADTNNEDAYNVMQSKSFISKKDKQKEFICLPPRIYTQKYFDSIEIVTNPGDTKSGSRQVTLAGETENREMVNYYLYPVEKRLTKVFLNGRHALTQGAKENPVMPNSTQNGIFYDCGCRAWPKEMLDMRSQSTVYQETRDVFSREGLELKEAATATNQGGLVAWTGSPAGDTFYGARRHFSHAHARFSLGNGMEVRAINLAECKDTLDQCLDGFGSKLTSDTGSADEISAAVDDGFDRQNFVKEYLQWELISVTILFMTGIALLVLGMFAFTLYRTYRRVGKENYRDAFGTLFF